MNITKHARRPRPTRPAAASDPLARALRRALADETDPKARAWIERLLASDPPAKPRSGG